MGKLNDIGLKYGADKSSRFHNYLDFYEKHLPDRSFKGRLLEIGVMDGLSMKMWREYYPEAEIIGIDIKDMSYMHNSDWNVPESVKLLTLDGTKAKDMKPLGKFDIILDDGSHYWSHQQKSFEILYKQLNKGGVYIIEDLWTSEVDYYADAKINTLEYLNQLKKKGMKMTFFRHKHDKMHTVLPEFAGLDSQTVIIPAGQ